MQAAPYRPYLSLIFCSSTSSLPCTRRNKRDSMHTSYVYVHAQTYLKLGHNCWDALHSSWIPLPEDLFQLCFDFSFAWP
jgi:hypothetical protein